MAALESYLSGIFDLSQNYISLCVLEMSFAQTRLPIALKLALGTMEGNWKPS